MDQVILHQVTQKESTMITNRSSFPPDICVMYVQFYYFHHYMITSESVSECGVEMR